MSDLKPCPWCLVPNQPYVDHVEEQAWEGRCDICDCAGPSEDSQTKAAAAWNRRAPRFTEEERLALKHGVFALSFRGQGSFESRDTLQKMIDEGIPRMLEEGK